MVTIIFVSCIEFTSYIIDSVPVASMVTICEKVEAIQLNIPMSFLIRYVVLPTARFVEYSNEFLYELFSIVSCTETRFVKGGLCEKVRFHKKDIQTHIKQHCDNSRT